MRRAELEAVLLTGGASRRMGKDKASLTIDGEPLGLRIAKLLATRAERVTVLGRTPIAGFEFLCDDSEFAGPLVALSRFRPSCEFVFVASCDLVRFEPELIDELLDRLGDRQAAIPVLGGRDQPLCALYAASALDLLASLVASGETRIMTWISNIDAVKIAADELSHGLACTNVNRPADLETIVLDRKD
jgi:molybdopterin-guanine dinucleotide biosynthesis protein A